MCACILLGMKPGCVPCAARLLLHCRAMFPCGVFKIYDLIYFFKYIKTSETSEMIQCVGFASPPYGQEAMEVGVDIEENTVPHLGNWVKLVVIRLGPLQ